MNKSNQLLKDLLRSSISSDAAMSYYILANTQEYDRKFSFPIELVNKPDIYFTESFTKSRSLAMPTIKEELPYLWATVTSLLEDLYINLNSSLGRMHYYSQNKEGIIEIPSYDNGGLEVTSTYDSRSNSLLITLIWHCKIK